MTDSVELRGATALVTGASRGIGLAIADALAGAGAAVGLVARGRDALADAARRVRGIAFPADVSEPDSVDQLASEVLREFGAPPRILVNAAGTFALANFAETSPDLFDRQYTANLRGPFLVIRSFLPQMVAAGGGHIVNVGSVAGRLPLPGNAAYGASKAGLHGLHEILAVELRGTGVKATLLEPSATDTPLWDPLDPDSRDDLPARATMLRPDDVARAVLFCVTQAASVEISHLALRAI